MLLQQLLHQETETQRQGHGDRDMEERVRWQTRRSREQASLPERTDEGTCPF